MSDISTRNIGETLRQARTSKNISIEDASNQVKIRAKYIRALEDNNQSDIPASVYVRGYLRSYAEFLGLSADDILQDFQEQFTLPAGCNFDSITLKAASRFSAADPNAGGTKPKWLIAIISLILTVSVLVAWSIYDSNVDNTMLKRSLGLISEDKAPESEDTAAITLASENYTTYEAKAPINPEDISPTAPLQKALTATPYALLARGKTWVKVFKDTQELIIDKALSEGDTLFLPPYQGLKIKAEHPHLLDLLSETGEMKPLPETNQQLSALSTDFFGISHFPSIH